MFHEQLAPILVILVFEKLCQNSPVRHTHVVGKSSYVLSTTQRSMLRVYRAKGLMATYAAVARRNAAKGEHTIEAKPYQNNSVPMPVTAEV